MADAEIQRLHAYYAALDEESLDEDDEHPGAWEPSSSCDTLSSGTSEELLNRSTELPLGQPRRATHDGTFGRTSSPSMKDRRNPTPQSQPARLRGKVRWADDVVSPKLTRQALHRRARGLTEGSLASTASANAHPHEIGWEVKGGNKVKDRKRKRKEPVRVDM
eukprot:CAMPEP_0174721244 /NCGR_PEP_ID=MMETSP1094-20130205/35670_1 /TAXON_ID=156173 /ORGANISM="Chrysochromulina brevifilum, Strain UTEX LB 985" /LENGTH=162 /DNA_ID=CAMNT_0015921891 /DNA_START=132 /DNA_END=620 /DNA_ORIENTATION=-